MPVMTDEGAEATRSDGGDDAAPPVEETVELTESTGDAGRDAEAAVPDDLVTAHRRRPDIRTAAAGVVVVVLIAATGFLGWQVWQQHQLEAASAEAQRAAVSYAQVLTSIDSDTVDENFAEVLDGATGEFKDMYSQSSEELRQLLIENRATARGVVVESAVQSASRDKAVVLLFVDQSVSNTKLPDPRIDRSRMMMTLEKLDGRWRASKVELP